MELKNFSVICSSLGLCDLSKMTLLDASELVKRHTPFFPPDMPTLILGLENIEIGSIISSLLPDYPKATLITLFRSTEDIRVFPLSELIDHSGLALFIPARVTGSSFESFQEIIAHLRDPLDGCPWDKEQTHLSLRKHLLEECYETIDAMDEEDPQKMCEEFGDLLLQIVLNAQIAFESNEFSMADILQGISGKIIRRHPHVFGEEKVDGVNDVLSNWEIIKAGERKDQGQLEKGILDGLPSALPALIQAQEYQERAARVGFDWPEIDGVLEKIIEEVGEIHRVENHIELIDELGDLFFVLVNFARWKKIDAESALRGANHKFKGRFKYIEGKVHSLGKSMKEMTIEEFDLLWNEAKKRSS